MFAVESGSRSVPLTLIASAALACFYRTPWSASGLPISPDSVSYCVVAQRLATLGRLDIELNHVRFPPAYPPWFSLVLSPIYRLFPDDPGAGVLAIPLFGVLLALAIFVLTDHLSNVVGGLIAAASVCVAAKFTGIPNYVMTDVPATALIVVATAIAADVPQVTALRCLLIGALLALAFGFRSTNALPLLVLAPAIWLRQRKTGLWLLALAAPPAIVALATLAYNRMMFGDALRVGYQFWYPVPYDFLSLTFSPRYAVARLASGRLAAASALAIALGLGAAVRLVRTDRATAWAVSVMGLTSILVIVVFQLYFYVDTRFYFVPCVFGVSLLSALVGRALAGWRGATQLALVCLGALVILGVARRRAPWPAQRYVLEAGRRIENDAVIVTAIDPLYFEPWVLRGTKREIVPPDHRSVAYSNTRYERIRTRHERVPPPTAVGAEPYDDAKRYVGGQDAFPVTADDLETLLERYRERPIYVDLSTVDAHSPVRGLPVVPTADPGTAVLAQVR
jgi:hypothetical protein